MNIYLDLDGVIADFDLHFKNLFGVSAEEADNTSKLWELMHSKQDFFREMPLMEDALVLMDFLDYKGITPIILTAIPKQDKMPLCTQHKFEWVVNNFGHLPFRIGPHAKDKHKHCQFPTDILIDDRESNILEWSAAGGISIHHKSANLTIEELKKHLK